MPAHHEQGLQLQQMCQKSLAELPDHRTSNSATRTTCKNFKHYNSPSRCPGRKFPFGVHMPTLSLHHFRSLVYEPSQYNIKIQLPNYKDGRHHHRSQRPTYLSKHCVLHEFLLSSCLVTEQGSVVWLVAGGQALALVRLACHHGNAHYN